MDNNDVSREIQQLKTAVAELTLLNELALAASSSLEVDHILDIIVEKSIRALRAEQGSIMLVSLQADAPLKTLIRQDNLSQQGQQYKVGTHISGWVLKYRKSLIVEDLASDDRFHVSADEARMISTLIAVPIQYKGNMIGVLIMTNKKNGEKFSNDDQRLLNIIAAQSAQLIRNSQLQIEALEKKRLEYELDLAHDIQQKLLPEQTPKIPGFDIASYFKPHESVSGDYYDYFPLSATRLGLMLADVSGHGPPAALVMTLVKGVTHSIVSENKTPGTILTEINNIICRIIPPEMFVTMLFMFFDRESNKILLANAGHNPVIYYSNSSSRSEILAAKDFPINVMPDTRFEDQVLDLDDISKILLFTDGLPEAENQEGEMLGIDPLCELLSLNHQSESQTVIDETVRLLNSHRGDQQISDDIVIIAVDKKNQTDH